MAVNHPRNIQNIDKTDNTQYAKYAGILKIFNQDMAATKVDSFREPKFKKVIRWGLNGINTLLNLAGTYYMTSAFLAMLAAPLLGTPAGWAIIVIAVVGQMAAQFAMRQDSLYGLINPSAVKNNATQERINKFIDQSEAIPLQEQPKKEIGLKMTRSLWGHVRANDAKLVEQELNRRYSI